VVILLAANTSYAAASAVIVRAGIAPAFAGAAMVADNFGRQQPHCLVNLNGLFGSSANQLRQPRWLINSLAVS